MRLLTHTLAAIIGFAAVATAHGEQLVLESDKSILINMTERPGTVVVGNPAIADISINGKTIFLHGRGYGNTDIIVLDLQGKQIANFDVSVKQAQGDAVSFFTVRPATVVDRTVRISYSCAPTCETNLQIGDWSDHFKMVAEENKGKNELATGSKTAETDAPSAAQ
jgi:Flp pilus assembly secretin CpaC